MTNMSGHDEDTAYQLMLSNKFVTIVSPQHSLHGQKAEVIKINQPPESDITVKLQNGSVVNLPLSWTDYIAPTKNINVAHLLEIEGLLEVVRLVKRIKEEKEPLH